jgi:phosphoglucosamine mutase
VAGERSVTVKFGTDGVRGVANVDLTASFALDLGRAAARVLATGPNEGVEAVVGGDTRLSTAMLEAAFVAGMAAEGVVVHRLGVVPTPAVAFEAARRNAIGAVISASHNPYRDNGIKLFARGGIKLPDEVEARIERQVDDLPPPTREPAQLLDAEETPDYLAHLVGALAGRDLSGLRIVVDCANGAASAIAPRLFTAAGADIVAIHSTPNGRNINDRCGATHLDSLAAAVVVEKGDLGLALDGDADRLLAVDHLGRTVDGDHIMAIGATDLHRDGGLRDSTIVTTVMSNLGFRLAMERAGIRVIETPVGDRYVLEALDEGGYTMGGEQSGHVIFRDLATTGDGLLTGILLADVVKRAGAPLADLAAVAMTRLPQVLLNIPVVERVPDAADQVASEIAAAEARLGGTGRVLVRPSGTESLLRVMVEATDATVAHEIAEQLAAVVRDRWGIGRDVAKPRHG